MLGVGEVEIYFVVLSDSRSKVASDPSSPAAFTNRTQVSALPSDRFYEDARTGYEEESNQEELSMLLRNQVSQYDSNEPSMANEDAELREEPSVPTVASRAALEDDLNLSDSDDENDKSTGRRNRLESRWTKMMMLSSFKPVGSVYTLCIHHFKSLAGGAYCVWIFASLLGNVLQ